MPENPYIIIVTYNAMQWIEDCLNSCGNYEVVVVDNNSGDDTLSYIKSEFPSVHLLEQHENLGFGQGNNLGISYALSKGAGSVFLLNQDARLEEGSIARIVEVSEKNPGYGILSPVHMNWEGEQLEHYFAKFTAGNNQFNSDFADDKAGQDIYDFSFVQAAAWFIPRSTLELIGGFDPVFFHYGEDNNYCQRVTYHGLKIGVVSGARIFHDSKLKPEVSKAEFSEVFFEKMERDFISNHADINRDYEESSLRSMSNRHLKLAYFHLFTLNFKKYKGHLKAYKLKRSLINKILQSRKINIEKGAHYLNY